MELFEAAHWFVEFGANPIARDKMGMTPWDIWLQLAKGEEEKLDLLNIEFIRRSCDNGTQLSTSDFRRQSTEDLFTDWSIPGWIDAQISARMPVRDMTWLRMNKNNVGRLLELLFQASFWANIS